MIFYKYIYIWGRSACSLSNHFDRKVYILDVFGPIPEELWTLSYLFNLYGSSDFFLTSLFITLNHYDSLYLLQEFKPELLDGFYFSIGWQFDSNEILVILLFHFSPSFKRFMLISKLFFRFWHYVFLYFAITRGLSTNALTGLIPKEIGRLKDLVSL